MEVGCGLACPGDGRRDSEPRIQPWVPPTAHGATSGLLGRGSRGSSPYSDLYGDESQVLRIHSGNGPHEEMDRRAIACFDEALADAGLADDDRLSTVLHDYFEWATTNSMSRYRRSEGDVPDGLAIPHWSWDGLVS